jgi:hypothetical protein
MSNEVEDDWEGAGGASKSVVNTMGSSDKF